MNQNQKKKYPPYWEDDRSNQQKIITEKLIKLVSNNNLKRHSNSKFQIELAKTQIIFVTICGVPPHKNQFSNYRFPGKVINYYPPCFDQNLNEDVNQKKLNQISMENSAIEIDQIVKTNGNHVILIYHSFGGSIAAWYCQKYPQKIKGLISLGGPSIRFYPILKDYAKSYLSIPDINREFIIQNYEVVYSMYDNKMKNHSSKVRFKNKYELLSFTLHNDKQTLQVLFDMIRQLPLPILMIYGQHDDVMTPTLCYQNSAYMAYLRKQSQNCLKDQQKIKRYFNICKQKYDSDSKNKLNLQQKLIYFLPGGHSIHIIQKNIPQIQSLIDQYLFIVLGGNLKQKNNENKSQINRSSKL